MPVSKFSDGMVMGDLYKFETLVQAGRYFLGGECKAFFIANAYKCGDKFVLMLICLDGICFNGT